MRRCDWFEPLLNLIEPDGAISLYRGGDMPRMFSEFPQPPELRDESRSDSATKQSGSLEGTVA